MRVFFSARRCGRQSFCLTVEEWRRFCLPGKGIGVFARPAKGAELLPARRGMAEVFACPAGNGVFSAWTCESVRVFFYLTCEKLRVFFSALFSGERRNDGAVCLRLAAGGVLPLRGGKPPNAGSVGGCRGEFKAAKDVIL